MSIRLRLMEAYLRATLQTSGDVSGLEEAFLQRQYPTPAKPTRSLRAVSDVFEEKINGWPVYRCIPRYNKSRSQLIFIHGGGFVNTLLGAHWQIVRSLIKATGATVTVPIYPLAPEHDHQPAFALVEQVFRALLTESEPQHIAFCGDSAGANLALTQVLHLRAQGMPLPGELILFSPWLDLTLADPMARSLEPRDVMLRVDPLRQMARWWAGDTEPDSPLLSPLFADLNGLPPIQIFQGTHDIFLPDVRTFRSRVTATGGSIRYRETPGGFHSFVGAVFTPEARDVFSQIAEYRRF